MTTQPSQNRAEKDNDQLGGSPYLGFAGIIQPRMAGQTRLELATSGVTGRRSNQLNYCPEKGIRR